MTGERPAGLTGAQLKTIAVAAMILDHIGVVFVPAGTVLHWALRCAGRLTMPIMCFFCGAGILAYASFGPLCGAAVYRRGSFACSVRALFWL